MSKISIGKSGNKNISFDLDTLLPTRLLIQANSGQGKSWLLRLIAERAFGKVQIILIDPEGEFATLREKYDYVLVGKGGETPANVRTAGLLAHKLLELHASAVCDLYEMKVSDRHQWVKAFLDAMIDAPKKFWHPVLVIVDEAHVFCPEKGAGESEASDAMISLATRGRKRGFCAVFATQRLGKLRKDAAAELTNVLIGGTFIDIDRKRAAEALGIPKNEEHQFFDEIKVIQPGNFWALGRAISKERVLVSIGDVETQHPESGTVASEPPPAPDKIKALLPKLSELPQEAEKKARTEQELRTEITTLKRQLSTRPTVEVPQVERVEVPVFQNGEIDRIENVSKTLSDLGAQLITASRDLFTVAKSRPATPVFVAKKQPIPALSRPSVSVSAFNDGGGEKLGKAHRSILTVLAQYPDGKTDVQLALLSGYAVGTGGFNNAVGNLRTCGYLNGSKSNIRITQEGLQALGEYEFLPMGADLVEYWKRKLGKAERQAFDVLVSIYPQDIDRDELASAAGYTPGAGGINNAIGRLGTLELATKTEARRLRAAEELFN